MKFKRGILNSIVCSLLFSASLTQASDLDIYASAGSGKTIITMMLDTSGSMTSVDIRIPGLTPGRKITVGYTDPNDSSKNITRELDLVGSNGYLSRMTVLKYSLINLLADPNKISDDKVIGLGHFNQGGRRKHNGVIDYPARPLTKTHREALIDVILKLKADSVTPTASAYAETAAYMLGSTTYSRYYRNYSGTYYSNDLTKDGYNYYKYKSPITNVSSCDGYGIYFLTDGVPTRYKTWHIEGVMETSLSKTDKTVTCSNSNWNCIFDMSKKLRNIKLDRRSTKPAIDIKTAVVGYGSGFSSTKNRIKIGKVTAEFPEQESYADCKSISSSDERNTCLWGSKPFVEDPKKKKAGFYEGYKTQIDKLKNNGGYGEGGFYYAENADDVAYSVLKFIKDLESDVEPISTGVFSVPLDPLNANNARDSAYLPMMVPDVGSNNLWLGNVKKYTIDNGTIKGNLNSTATKAVIFDANGSFTKDTYDMWSAVRAADKGDTMKGGVFGKIFSVVDASATPKTYHKDRNIFVNTTDTVLKKLTIDDAKKPKHFDDLHTDINADMKRSIANFMGYPVSTQNIKDGEVITKDFSPSHKVHGAVLHSKPVLITKSARIDTNNDETREDYVLYGSFDGALHIVDDETGLEKFTFLPKEIIKEQHKYLIKDNKSSPTQQFYGVDAPWAVYSDYSVNVEATTKDTIITPKQIFAFGGLRMGGSKYYALDLTNLDSASSDPSLLFTIGSEYGASNNPVNSTVYARMGQTWAKPTIIYLKESKNETVGTVTTKIPVKKMVTVFPGGYDMKYEDPNYSSSLTPTGSDIPLGNAIYMVEVGKITKNNAGVSRVDTASAGTLLKTLTQTPDNSVSNKSKGNKYMINSIVSQVKAIDSDYDGYTDNLYFSDLGGQVFRVDIDNSGDESEVVEVVRLFSAESQRGSKTVGGSTIKDSKPRFYETPLVTFERRESDNKIVGIVTVASGNRSKPLHKRINKDKIYTFLDKDVSNSDANFTNRDGTASSYSLNTHNLTMNNLQKLSFTIDNSGIAKEDVPSVATDTIKNNMDSNRIEGWYYDLENWNNGNTTIEGIKVFSPLNAVNGYLYYTSFNPNISTNTNSCSAQIKGASQRETLCLPYGSCTTKDSSGRDIKIKYQSRSAGRGIVENTIGFLKLKKVLDSNKNCIKNCDIDDHEIGLITNNEINCTKPNDPDFNPLTACPSANKKLFPLKWKSSD